ncbi:facilitated trehalose transporter Tret1 [Amyelois transitella]|uniref:facilitated trehalose transporter Tret1 n=1 Tax=Amyelois transitella TaxID=680683 RepID=UPI00067AF56A|nr:facilitated trehalose transporter Tret1 [Amyelois transitella]
MVSPFVRQVWTVSGVLLNMCGQGMLLSYSAVLLPALAAHDAQIQTDLDTNAWISSSVGVAGIPGFILSSYLMSRWGRRIAHALVILPGVLGWTLISFANNVSLLLIGRILGGVTAGATVGLGAVVIGEFTDPENRGMFLNLKTAAVCLGSTVVHILGHFLNWRLIALIALVPHIGALGIVCTWPESPAWLASRSLFQRAQKSFIWLRGDGEKAMNELEELIRAQKMNLAQPTTNNSFEDNMKEFVKKFLKKDFLKPLLIVIVAMMLLETSGRHIFPAYAIQIIGTIVGNKTQSFYYVLAIDLITTISATFSSVLVKLMKRRTLLFSTGYSSVVVLLCLCGILFLQSKGFISANYSWIPIGLFVIYFILANLGCAPIPLALLGEVFPMAHRSTGSCLAGIIMSVNVNLGLLLTPYMLVGLDVYGTFAVFALISAAFLLILYFVLPETKDRTLQEIEDYFNLGKFKDDEKVIGDHEGVKVKMLA